MYLNSKSKPDFSVIIPTFNRCNFLKKAIMSVLRQKNVSFEIIVSDNCSADNTPNVVREFNDKRIKYFRNKKNIGFPLNVRKCLQHISGRYVFMLSDDDFILDDNTFSDVLKVMKKYKVGMGNIGAIYWNKSPKYPCKIANLSDKLVIFDPKKDKKVLLKSLKICYAFYSGHIFDSSVINVNQVIESYTYSFYPMIFETIEKYGLAYIPNHFIVARISLRFVPHSCSLDRLGSFFMEDYLSLMKQFLHGKDYEKHRKEYVFDSVINLPTIKLFTDNRNYIRILQRTVNVDKMILLYPNFFIFALIGFLPKTVLKSLRNFMISLYEKRTMRLVDKKYNYFTRLQI